MQLTVCITVKFLIVIMLKAVVNVHVHYNKLVFKLDRL